MTTDNFWKYFFELFEALPRQGPGDKESSEKAFRLLPPLRAKQRILDIGCGSGIQTMDLARVSEARIVAIDKHPPFVDQLVKKAAEAGLSDRITAEVGDMTDLSFPDASFDVIWAEGSIFIIGFSKGLTEWRRLLEPNGYMVISEFCWFHENPAAELSEMFLRECEVGNVEARRQAIADAGYRLVDDFILPDAGWDNYYVPLAECLDKFEATHKDNPEALEVAAHSRHEIDLHQRYPGAYGYVFFIVQPNDDLG